MSKITVHNMKGFRQNNAPSSEDKLSNVAEKLKDLANELTDSKASVPASEREQNGRLSNGLRKDMNGHGTMTQQQTHLPTLELSVSRKGNMPQKHQLKGDLFTFGRSESSHIVLEDHAISRDHVHIKRVGGEWQVVDLGSTNGSYLSGRRLTPYIATKWHPLMQLRVGPFYINQRNDNTLIEAPARSMPAPVAPPRPAPQPRPVVVPIVEETRIAPPPQSSPPTKSTIVDAGFMTTAKQKRQLRVAPGKGMLLFEFPSEIIESMRHLVNRVAKTGQFPERLALTSALREEGVTYVSRALGATLANDLEAKVCVVELNWWNPASLPPQADHGGVAGILARRTNIENALLRTNNPKLFILPAGSMPPANRSIASRSTGLRQVMQQLGEYFDYIILDVPAVLTTNDAAPIAAIAESCCLIVNQGATPIEDVKTALDELNHLPMLGAVMNKMDYSTPKGVLRLIS